MRVRIQFRTLCSRTARQEIAVLLTLVLLPMTVQALDDWQPLPAGKMDRIAFTAATTVTLHSRSRRLAVEHNFGLLEIDWDVEPWPMLTLKAMNEDGSVVVSHEISLGDLQ